MPSYRFYCHDGSGRVAKWQRLSLASDADAFAHAADLFTEGPHVSVEIVDGIRELGSLPAVERPKRAG